MEEQGVPRRNVILAAVLAVIVYAVWYKFLLPKPSPTTIVSQQQPAASLTAPVIGQSSSDAPLLGASSSVQEPVEIDFKTSSVEGAILLHEGGAIAKLKPLETSLIKKDHAIIESGNFFRVKNDLPGNDSWVLISSQGDSVILEKTSPAGVLRKEMVFSSNKLGFGRLKLSFRSQESKTKVNLGVDLDAHLPYTKDKPADIFAGYQGSKSQIVRFLKKKQTQADGQIEEKYPLSGAGLSSRYHLAMVYGLDQASRSLTLARRDKDAPWELVLALSSGEAVEIPFYLGLKTDAALKELGVANMLYGGVLGPLKKLVKWTLGAFYKVTGNYGFAIIFLTLAFQIVLLPFTLKNLKFSQRMKDLSPKIKVLQEKYKHDPQKMNTEMMQLYKTHGANPLGGCLTMLLQMPIFFALYGALNDSYELYDAPFILWIKNLAAHDPTYVLPILMGVAMFIQTWKNQGTIADPSQKMMMYVMPVMFTFMFFKFPSGLVLYWFTSNVVSLGLTTILPKYMDKIT